MSHRNLIRLALAVALLPLLHAAAAGADSSDTGDRDTIAWANDNSVNAQASTETAVSAVASKPGAGSSAEKCTHESLPPEMQAQADQVAASGYGPPKGQEPGTWVRQVCIDARGNAAGLVIWARQRAAPVDPAALAQQALGSTPLPSPAIALNPSSSQGEVVNFTMWMWLTSSWAPVSASASAGPVTATVTAVPIRSVWDMGDGSKAVTCGGPGTAYDSSRPEADQHSDCTFVYRRSSSGEPNDTFTLTATVTWHVTWVAVGAAGGGDLGTVSRSTSLPVRVGEIQAVNDSSGNGA
jgi:hypothetical protein